MKKTSILILFFIISCTASQEDSLKKTANPSQIMSKYSPPS